MPELPEVEITKNKISPILNQKIIDFFTDKKINFKLSNPNFIKKDIKSRKVLKIKRLGKAILIYLSKNQKNNDEKIIAFHQKMSGKLILLNNKNLKTNKHIHLKILFSKNLTLLFEDQRRFGVVWYGKESDVLKDNFFKNLGKDALNINFLDFQKIFRNKKGKIKPFLLNQKNLAGIGNILADEILWLAQIHPQTEIKNLTKRDLKKLWLSLKRCINTSIKLGGSTLRNWKHPDLNEGKFLNNNFVYNRENQNCKRCKNKIIKIKLGGRGTYLCPKCQKIN
jgi:formamidopyrimidine-DNA glycosylase